MTTEEQDYYRVRMLILGFIIVILLEILLTR
jgi:hypothetical protein